MRTRSLAVVAAVAAGVLGLAGTAQARVAGPHPAAGKALKVQPATVAAGVATGVSVQNPCPTGTQPSSVTGMAAPNGTTTNVQAAVAEAPKSVKLDGVWPAPGKTSYTITVNCPGGQSGTGTVKVESAPLPADIDGVGADATGELTDQFSADYNSAHTSGHLYSWDAENPVSGVLGDTIPLKQGCSGGIARPNGSGAGISALTTENGTTSGHPCIDFARSSSPRSGSNPTTITFVTFAGDAVSYAIQPTSNAPGNLTTAQLTGIYNCTITNWNQVGGKSGKIAPFIPQPGSGLRSFFLAALGLTAPGACVSDDNGNLLESEGVNPVLNSNKPNVIVPYSVGKYLAERYHSAACFNTSCTPNSGGLICPSKAKKNLFGCNTRGTLVLGEINGTAPTVPWPLTDKTTTAKINTGFSASFVRFLYNVVDSPEFTIPASLQPLFSSTGWLCTNATAQKDITSYGFITLPAGTAPGDCGSLS